MRTRTVVGFLLVAVSDLFVPAARATGTSRLGGELESLLDSFAISGGERDAVDFVASRLGDPAARRDAYGDLVLEIGSGGPRRLVACPLAEPGFVVGGIGEGGWLRLIPADDGPTDPLFAESVEGESVRVLTPAGAVPGVVAVRSVHLQQERPPVTEPPFDLADAWVDVGAENAEQVAALGIRLLDPVGLERRPVKLADGDVAGPAAGAKGACEAVVDAARRVAAHPPRGSVVFAWTVGDRLGRRGLEEVVRELGPFAAAAIATDRFGWKDDDGKALPVALPPPGRGFLSAGDVGAGLGGGFAAPISALVPSLWNGNPELRAARVAWFALPASRVGTPVETVAPADVEHLSDALVRFAGGDPAAPPPAAAPLPSPKPPLAPLAEPSRFADTLAALVGRSGVAHAVAEVRDEVRRRLPAWAHPTIDAAGDLMVEAGAGDDAVVLVAHLDEVGFVVKSIRDDGRLELEVEGGFYPSLWEGQAAVVHAAAGEIPGVFEPRPDWRTATARTPPLPLVADVGAGSRAAAETLGIRPGDPVVMPKRLLRLGRHRAAARAMDDRVGDTALVEALARIDPRRLPRRVVFVWSLGEEIGLDGSQAVAGELAGIRRAYGVDTFVSSESPLESKRFADTPLGRGPVLRALDNAMRAPDAMVERIRAAAARIGVPLQTGFTGGTSDALAFLGRGVPAMTVAWPGRYSHSPVEVMDLRDGERLVDLLVELATEPPASR